jgi:hypothetical protein
MRRLVMLAAVAAVAFTPAFTASAGPAISPEPAVYGALTQLPGGAGCIVNQSTPLCQTEQGIAPSSDVAVAPNGKYVATADEQYNAVVVWKRHSDGSLTFVSCASETGTISGTPSHTCLPDANLQTLSSVTFTGDGKNLLATSYDGGFGELSNYNFAPATGAVSFNPTTPCVNSDGSNGCKKRAALGSADDVVEDPVSNRVYVGSDVGLVGFSRDTATGGLTEFSCVDETGDDGCETNAAIEGADSVAVDPVSGLVWVASRDGEAVVSERVASNGVLTKNQCFWSAASAHGCSKTAAVYAPSGITVGPTDTIGARNIYVTDYNGNVLLNFATSGTSGSAAYEGCRSYNGTVGDRGVSCTTDVNLEEPQGVVVSPDGRNVYIASDRSNPPQGSQVIAAYSRDLTTGALTPLPDPYACIKAGSASGSCPVGNGIDDPWRVAVSPDGANVYLADRFGDSTEIFSREVPPVCVASTTHSAKDAKVTITLPCVDANGDSLKYTMSSVKHGKLGKVNSGKVTFTPTLGFHGTASFTVSASDGGLSSAKATAKITASKGAMSLTLVHSSVPVKAKKHADLRLSCAGPSGQKCVGTVALHTATGGASYGSKKLSIAAGKHATVTVTLNSAGRHAVTHSSHVAAKLKAHYVKDAGHTVTLSKSVTLKS